MPGLKRRHGEDADLDGNVHPSRKRRADYNETNAQLAKILNKLGDEVPSVRLDATRSLLQYLAQKSDDQGSRNEHVLTRLIKGVCSGAKAARPGFSIALTEVIRLLYGGKTFADDAPGRSLLSLVDKVTSLTMVENRASGEEKRNCLLGRRFAFQALLQSQALTHFSNDSRYVFDAIAELAKDKHWLRSECGAMLCEFLKDQDQLSSDIVRALLDSWASKGLLKSAEGVALWLTVRKRFPSVKLPSGFWHHNNPLASQDRAILVRILLRDDVDADSEANGPTKKKSGARQIMPGFAWSVVLSHLFEQDDNRELDGFWSGNISSQIFSATSSTERKALGLQIVAQAVSAAPPDKLNTVITQNVVQCIVDQRVKSDRFLFEAAKVPLHQMELRSKKDVLAAPQIACALLNHVPSSLDKLTRSTIENVVKATDSDGLLHVVNTISKLCYDPPESDPNEAEKKRRLAADILLFTVRAKRGTPDELFSPVKNDGERLSAAPWLSSLLILLAELGYIMTSEKPNPSLSASIRTIFRERLGSALGHLVGLPIKQAVVFPSIIIETIHSHQKQIASDMSDATLKLLKQARRARKEASQKALDNKAVNAATLQAFNLLLSLGMLQVYDHEPDSEGVLTDIISCYQKPIETDADSSAMLIELLLSFLSKQSALLRKLAEQVFVVFAPDVTAEGLQSMLDILEQKENLAGQQELFDQQDEDNDGPGVPGTNEKDEEDEESDDDDVEVIDADDLSDIEIIDGEEAGTESTASSDSANDEDDSEDDEAGDDSDEVAAFNRKLADALGTSGVTADDGSDTDGSDMDDEQMMALEPHLTTIFKERRKTSSKKQTEKAAKSTILAFKARVLDLLDLYVKAQPANSLALTLILPLITLTRTSTKPDMAARALAVLESYFDTCKKQKAIPSPVASDVAFSILDAVHAEMRTSVSKVHTSACSRASLFLARVLVALEKSHWPAVANMYVTLQDEWRRDPKSKIRSSVFNDWHSWSMQR